MLNPPPDPSNREHPRPAMKSHTDYITLNLPTQMGFLNITPRVEEAIRNSGVK